MKPNQRIYAVCDSSNDTRLVRASHPSHALMYVARNTHEVRVATQHDLETLLPAGTKVEEISQEQQELTAV